MRQVRGLEGVCLAVVLALLSFSAAFAQSSATPPAATVQLSDQQLDQIVKSVTGAVLSQMQAGQPTAGPQAPATADQSALARLPLGFEEGVTTVLEGGGSQLASGFGMALRGIPGLGAEIASIAARLDASPEGRGPLAFLGLLAVVLAAALALGVTGAAAARRWLPGTPPQGGAASIGETLRYAAASLAGFSLFWLVTAVATQRLFGGADMQSIVGRWLLQGAAQMGLICTAFLILFRPSEAAYRMVPLDARDAAVTLRMFVIIVAVAVFRSWIFIAINDNQPEPVLAAGFLFNNLLFVSSFFVAAWPARAAVGRWIETATGGNRVSRRRRWLAAHWLSLGGICVLALAALHAYGAVTGRPGVANGLIGTMRAVLLMILVCSVIEFMGRRGERTDALARRAIPKLPGLVSKMLRVFITLGAAIYFIRLWFVDALGVMSPAAWSGYADLAFEPIVALFGGYLAISYVNFLAARYLATHQVSARVVSEDGDAIRKVDDSSRLRTLVPIMRMTSVVIVVIMTGLLVLSHMGFNITPLLAGASVIGLAISFGSQALVKDIVSGVLFLAEDSFRVGEYIECGNSRGTVEGFTLRSVRLRHSDGQIYTVPFGQMGEIINFSRDWSTVKFSMSLDRDTDLENVRNTTRRVADDLKADFRERLLDPLKLQGVNDVTDSAIVVQFKLRSLPRDPGEIERAARIRLLKAFKEDGIALSGHP